MGYNHMAIIRLGVLNGQPGQLSAEVPWKGVPKLGGTPLASDGQPTEPKKILSACSEFLHEDGA